MVKLKICVLPFLIIVWASLTGVLGADELPPQIEARLLEARARAAASVGDLATAEVLFKKSLQIGGNEISPDGLIRILLLNQSYDEVASTVERYGTAMPESERKVLADILEAWNDKLRANPNRAEVLAAAAEFYTTEIQELAAALLARAMELEPDSLEWKKQNAFLQELMDENEPDTDQEQLEVAEESLRQATEAERGSLLTSLVMTAYDAGAHERASEVARELLSQPQDKGDWNSGNAFHKSHLVLGLIALDEGDVEAAKQHLLDSAETHGSPQLNSFGPNMRLAEALLIEGERDTVLKYLDLCSSFWRSPYIKQWTEEIEAGDLPDFGANLRY